MQESGYRAVRLGNIFSLRCKALRAAAIKEFMAANSFNRCVCFSCGNSSKALKEAGIDCVDISPQGDLIPSSKWWSKSEIRSTFADCFDATSGHLPVELMSDISKKFKQEFKDLIKSGCSYDIPTGSGETVFCLKLAFPDVDFTAVYSKSDKTCTYNPEAPLNPIIKAFFKNRIEE